MQLEPFFNSTIYHWLILIVLCSCQTIKEDNPLYPGLYQNYRQAFSIGSALNEDVIYAKDTQLVHIALQHFNTITPENVMKAGPINPLPGQFNFGPADAFVEFGEEHDLFIVGHTLIWHNQTPDWFFKHPDGSSFSHAEQLERMCEHIKTVAGRYQGRVQAWDVVNEIIDNDGSYRPTTWVNGIGDGDTLVKYAFMFAAQYAPDAELYYNDFNAWRPEKRDGIIRMVKKLKEQNIRIDGIGMQGHWGLNFPKNAYIEEAIRAYAALGVKVMITELDIEVLPLTKEGQIIGTGMMHPQFQLEEFEEFLDPYPKELPENIQRALTNRYRELFELFYDHRDNLDRVTFWGIHDGMSWKNGYPIPNRTNYPLLFDRNKKPKPAVQAIAKIPTLSD